MASQPESTEPVAPTRQRRRWVLVGVPTLLVLLFVVTVFTGIPGVRPSMSSLNALADKINDCPPASATVDWVFGRVDTYGSPVGPNVELTPDELAMLGTHEKIGFIC